MEPGQTHDDVSLGAGPTVLHAPEHADVDLDLAPLPSSRLQSGTQLGRYVVLERLGAGGMGVVYTAWDPQLDRRLALKLLTLAPGRDPSQGRARLLREAQALARLVHPNVVSIHDVGTVGDQVFIAMEFVAGLSLRAWLDAGPRTCAEILAIFVAAGRGLEAAHAAGLIHRDFKPDNVVVGDDGRARVLDFGLARRGDDVDELRSSSGNSGPHPTISGEDSLGSLTRTGVLVGTPAYMSPEQFAGARLDARSDQFSFCVALWEALAGERPFAANRQAELVAAVSEGRRRDFPRGDREHRGDVPERIVQALARGLAPAPEDRWPDMSSLLAALEPAPPRRRGAWAMWSALVLALGVGTGVVLGDRHDDEPTPISCEVDEARLVGVWDEPRAAALERAFAATGLPWAPASAARLRRHFDGWIAEWSAMARDTCEAHHLRREQSAALFDRRMTCLDQRLRTFDSLVELLTPGPEQPGLDATAVEQALSAGLGLDGVESCADVDRLLATPTIDDPARAQALANLELGLERRELLQDLGQYARALEAGDALRPQLEALDDAASWSSYRQLRALDLIQLGRSEEALVDAVTALEAAGRSGHGETVLHAVLVLTRATLLTGHHDESTRWLRYAESLANEAADPWFRYELHKARAFLALVRRDWPGETEAFSQALAMAREIYGDDAHEVGIELLNVGSARIRWGLAERVSPSDRVADPEQLIDVGLAEELQARALISRHVGEQHPQVIAIDLARVGPLLVLGRVDEAEAPLAAAEARLAVGFEPDHGLVRRAVALRAWSLAQRGRCDLAAAAFDRQLAWLDTHRAGQRQLRVDAARATAACCGWSHPRALALLDQAVALSQEDEPATILAAQVLLDRALTRAAPALRAGVRLDDQDLAAAEADLAAARAILDERDGSAAPKLDPDRIADLLQLARDPDDAEAQARVLAARAQLDPIVQHELLRLLERESAGHR